MLRDDDVTHRGAYLTLYRVRLRPRPAVPPPLSVGGSSEASLTPPAPFGSAVERIQAPAEAAGRAIERDIAGGGREFVLRPAYHLAELAETVIPEFHTR